MRLSEREKRVLSLVELSAEEALESIALKSRFREHTVRYALQRLGEREVIGSRRPFINLNLLGFLYYTFYFSLASEDQDKKDLLLRKLQSSSSVMWIMELGGDYQYGVSLCARHINEITAFLNRVSLKIGNIFFEKSVTVRLSYTEFGRKYLSEDGDNLPEPLSIHSVQNAKQIDEVDEKILSAMAHYNYRSVKELSRKISIPATTLDRRKKKYEKDGIIAGYHYRVDAVKFGMQVFKLLVYVKGINPHLHKKLFQFSSQHKSVVYFIECVGNWDYELGVEVENARETTLVTQEIYDHFQNDIRTIKIIPVFGFLKYLNYPGQKGDS